MRRLAVALLWLAACSDSPGPRPLHYELGTCGVVDIHDEEAGLHVAQGTPIEYSTNPPSSGKHYPIWAAWDRTYASLDRGFWVHNAEHGAVVLLHRGTSTELEAGLADAVRAFPDDAMCEAPVRNRALVVADPLLPDGVDVAAVAWGVTYTATCVDPDALLEFHADFYARAPENLCDEGASLGGVLIQ
ncbi:MAG TPA: DUF3105 domain-containing protein [Kofleriaceae bacterium]|nr:DUF3105 domain-containing protein [Kofleriaceae bacterium]